MFSGPVYFIGGLILIVWITLTVILAMKEVFKFILEFRNGKK